MPRLGKAGDEFVLQVEEIRHRPVDADAGNDPAAARVDESGGDPEAGAHPLVRAGHAQAGREDPGRRSEFRPQGLGDAVTDPGVGGVARQIGEGRDPDGAGGIRDRGRGLAVRPRRSRDDRQDQTGGADPSNQRNVRHNPSS